MIRKFIFDERWTDFHGDVPPRKNALDKFLENYKGDKMTIGILKSVHIIEKGKDDKLAENLRVSEVECKCKSSLCNYTLISSLLVMKFQKLRNIMESPITVNSAYRCQSHNLNIGGEFNSYHCKGMAIDLTHPNLDLLESEARKIFPFVLKYDTFIHCDVRDL